MCLAEAQVRKRAAVSAERSAERCAKLFWKKIHVYKQFQVWRMSGCAVWYQNYHSKKSTEIRTCAESCLCNFLKWHLQEISSKAWRDDDDVVPGSTIEIHENSIGGTCSSGCLGLSPSFLQPNESDEPSKIMLALSKIKMGLNMTFWRRCLRNISTFDVLLLL